MFVATLKGGWTSGTSAWGPSLFSFVASSQRTSTESHALRAERKLPDYFPHTVRMQAAENVWQPITVKSFVCACECVHMHGLDTLSNVRPAAGAAPATVGCLSAGLNVTCDWGIF